MASFDPDTSEKIQQPLLITFHKLLGKNVFGQTLQRSSMLCGISGQMYGNGRCLASWGQAIFLFIWEELQWTAGHRTKT